MTEGDYNHIRNVLRMHIGESITVCDGQGADYRCEIAEYSDGQCLLAVKERIPSAVELPVEITLYQGLPKKDKMELIIEKAVELGAARIVPVACARSVVHWDDPAREEKKVKRFQAIAEAASKQSGRGVIPEVSKVLSFSDAMKEACGKCDTILFPYENAEGMNTLKKCVSELKPGSKIAVFIGPEGGFDPDEVDTAEQAGAQIVSLGRRILRTETAGLTMLSYLMIEAEMAEGMS